MEKTLFLVQHGDAVPEATDPVRPLSERGRQEVADVARAAARAGVAVAEIRHSGKLRAQQTAEILAACLVSTRVASEMSGLGPNDDPAAAARAVEEADGPLLLVGHLPHLGRLASLLIAGDGGRGVVAFRMGGLLALTRGPEGWRVRFLLTPDLARP
jgi:phosphohistidine phosphatase